MIEDSFESCYSLGSYFIFDQTLVGGNIEFFKGGPGGDGFEEEGG